MNQNITRDITILASETIDAGLFSLLRLTLKNNRKEKVPVIRFRVKNMGPGGSILGYQVGEIHEMRPLEIRKVEVTLKHDGTTRSIIDRALCFSQ